MPTGLCWFWQHLLSAGLDASFFVNAFNQAKHGSANMDTLVALSTGISYLFSTFNTLFPTIWHNQGMHPPVYFEASAVVIAFILLGKVLEERAKSNTSSAIKKLIGLQPKTVRVVQSDGTEIEISLFHKSEKNDQIVVKPGDKIPVDGEVISGVFFCRRKHYHGRISAGRKRKGAKVYTGTLNQKGSFIIAAQKVGRRNHPGTNHQNGTGSTREQTSGSETG